MLAQPPPRAGPMVPALGWTSGRTLARPDTERRQSPGENHVSATVQAAHPSSAWRAVVIGTVAVLAVGIGISAGSFLLTSRSAGGVGPGAAYVPASAPFYVEIAVVPSVAQDEALRELLGHFPPIDGLDLDRPLHEGLVELIDEGFVSSDADLSYAEDVGPWFGGTVAMAVTDIDPEAFADPMAVPDVPDVLVIASVTDPDAAETTVDKLLDEAVAGGADVTETEHRGVVIVSIGDEEGAYAITDDALLIGQTADAIRAGLDVDADGASLAEDAAWGSITAQLPDDRLLFGLFDLTDLMTASMESSAQMSGLPADAFDTIFEGQPMRAAFAVSAEGNLLALDSASDAPTGAFVVANEERGLADEVPADALYVADGGDLGSALTEYVHVVKEAAAADPTAAEELATFESALGADLEEFVSWIGDGAMVAGWDGSEAYAGLVIVPTDVEAARDRLDQLAGFARLGGLDPSMGVTVEESEVGGVTVTTIRWQDPMMTPDPTMPVPTGVAIEYAVSDDRVVIGVGDRFVGRVLELDAADSLGASERFADAVAAFGGANNAGVAWLDIDGVREALEATVLPFAEAMGMAGYDDVRPWLEPLDRLIFVSRLEGDVVVQRGGLLLD